MIPTTKIIAGSLFVSGATRVTFAIELKPFAASFSLADIGSIPMPKVTSSGQMLKCSSKLAGDSLGFGAVDFGGTAYAKLWFGGLLDFKGTPVVIPGGAGPKVVATPFKLTGDRIAYHHRSFR